MIMDGGEGRNSVANEIGLTSVKGHWNVHQFHCFNVAQVEKIAEYAEGIHHLGPLVHTPLMHIHIVHDSRDLVQTDRIGGR